jgi:hypothetical protein
MCPDIDTFCHENKRSHQSISILSCHRFIGVTFSSNIDEKIGSIQTHKTAPGAQTMAADICCVFKGGNA